MFIVVSVVNSITASIRKSLKLEKCHCCGPWELRDKPNWYKLLGYLLMNYKEHHPQGPALDSTLPQQYVYLADGRRVADRLIWAGLGRLPRPRRDPPSVAVEFVSPGSRNRKRDYEDKRRDYA